jgi:hypothetical protein
MTHSINDTQHNNALSCAECRYAECRILFTIMLSVSMLNRKELPLSVVQPIILIRIFSSFIVKFVET